MEMDIFKAAETGSIAVVRELAAANPQIVHQEDPVCQTPLHVAAYFGKQEVVEFLVAAGADVNKEDKQGDTPLQLAVKGLQANVDILSACGGVDQLSSHIPFVEDDKYEAVMTYLLDHGATRENIAKNTSYSLAVMERAFVQHACHQRIRQLAFILAMGTHARLGGESPLSMMSQYMLAEMSLLAQQSEGTNPMLAEIGLLAPESEGTKSREKAKQKKYSRRRFRCIIA